MTKRLYLVVSYEPNDDGSYTPYVEDLMPTWEQVLLCLERLNQTDLTYEVFHFVVSFPEEHND